MDELLRHFAPGLAGTAMWAPAVALVAGVLSNAVCPCTLPLGLGMAGLVGTSESLARRTGLVIAAAFFAGVVVNLTVLGALAGQLGGVLTDVFGRYWALAMALVSLAAALLAFWGPQLSIDRLVRLRRPGLLGSFGYGFIFAVGSAAAPLLLLLTVAAATARPAYGMALAFAFGVGKGLPFLLIGLFAGALTRLARLAVWRRGIQVVSGVALLFVSGYYLRVFYALL